LYIIKAKLYDFIIIIYKDKNNAANKHHTNL
jgi:hypothetical protein